MNIYVGNLSPDTTQEDLRKAFQAHGEVSSASLLTTRMSAGRGTGPSRGIGFVVMPNKAQADLRQAEAEVKVNEGAVQKARVDLDRCTIRSQSLRSSTRPSSKPRPSTSMSNSAVSTPLAQPS